MARLHILMTMLALFSPACAGSSTGPDPGKADGGGGGAPLRVMCFNVRTSTAPDLSNAWANRREMLVRTIVAFDPDLLGLQEVMPDQAAYLREALAGYGFVGVGRDDGRAKGEFSPIFYRPQRFELLGAGHFWLSETPDVPGSKSWDAALPRIATWVKLRDRRAGEEPGAGELLYVNTHWDHAGTLARLRSAAVMRQRIGSLVSPATAVIVTGDLNCTEDDEPYAILLGRGSDEPALIDSHRAAHPQRLTDEASFHGFKGTVAGSRIDFVLHSERLETVEASIDRTRENERYPSDHFPATAILRWR